MQLEPPLAFAALAALAAFAGFAVVCDLRSRRVPWWCTLGALSCAAVLGRPIAELWLAIGLLAGLLVAFLSARLLGGSIGGADVLWSGIVATVAPVAILVTWLVVMAVVVVVTRRGRSVGLPLVPVLVLAGALSRI